MIRNLAKESALKHRECKFHLLLKMYPASVLIAKA